MRATVTAILAFGLLCSGSVTGRAQWVKPVVATSHRRDADARSTRHAWRTERERPRARVVVPVAVLAGVAGITAGYHAAEWSCARQTVGECWDHVAYVPIGYTAGIALGGGIAGMAEGCATGLPRPVGGALLGLAVGVATLVVFDWLAIVAIPVAPVVGATWLVTSCRVRPRNREP